MLPPRILKTLLVSAAGLFAASAPLAAFCMTLQAVVQDGTGRPVQDAVVYALPADGAVLPPSQQAEAVMDQVNKEFTPYVLPVRTGTAVRFPNKDDIRHHVYSISPGKKFELPLYTGTPASPVVFDQAGVVVIGCNIHDWMVAYIFVVDTPYFGKTGKDGTTELKDLPPGPYEVRVWHPRMKELTERTAKRVTGPAQGDVIVDFTITFKIEKKPEWKTPRAPSPEGGRYR